MQELIIAIGLVLVIEGLMWAAFPHLLLEFLRVVEKTPESDLKLAGSIAMIIGVIIIWFAIG